MKKIFYCVCITFLVLGSCSKKDSLEKKMFGKWFIYKVYDGDNDVTMEHNPKNDRWIKFNRNGSFESDGTPYGYNDGSWEMDNDTAILFLDSREENDDSEWEITFKEGMMIWTGVGTPRQEKFKIIQKKDL